MNSADNCVFVLSLPLFEIIQWIKVKLSKQFQDGYKTIVGEKSMLWKKKGVQVYI